MKEHPILFTTDNVKAILDGRKTQTRRVIITLGEPVKLGISDEQFLENLKVCPMKCSYGQVGDILWVRETWATDRKYDNLKPSEIPHNANIFYKTQNWFNLNNVIGKTRPAIFLPRWASRITLEITYIRVQRLQEISSIDCIAEGVRTDGEIENAIRGWYVGNNQFYSIEPVKTYRMLWDFINGKTHPWVNNYWVWAITFTVPSQK